MKPGKGQTPGVSKLATEEDCHKFKASLCMKCVALKLRKKELRDEKTDENGLSINS